MRMLDLFSGAHTVGRVFEERGWNVVSIDNDPDTCPTILGNILELKIPELLNLGPFDFIWASPPCECFSVASIGKHWRSAGDPKSIRAQEAMMILYKTVLVMNAFAPRFWLIENPRGMMRKMPILQGYPRHTVSYCQYGDTRMKPTDLFGHVPHGWHPKMCKNGAPCHVAAPRGSSTGTQGMKGYLNRSAVPLQLVDGIAKEVEYALR
jgi:site-specific DNA-cytosine methylase